MEFMQFIVIAILIEAIVETLKMTWNKNKISIPRIIALFVSFIVCLAFHVDFFSAVGFTTTIPLIAYLLTGVIVSRGANFVSDLLQKLNEKED